MEKFHRYLRLIKASKFCLGLPKGSLRNFLKIKYGRINKNIGPAYTLPPMLSVYTTKRCNLQCSFCACGKLPTDWKDFELDPEKFSKILDSPLASKSIITVFSGGEPLLNPSIEELIKISRASGRLAGMVSNGLLLERKAEALVNAGLNELQISVYENTRNRLPEILRAAGKILPANASYVLLKSKLLASAKEHFQDLIELILSCQQHGASSLKFSICNAYPAQDGYDSSETITYLDKAYGDLIAECCKKLPDVNFSGYLCKNSWFSRRFSVFFPMPMQPIGATRLCRTPWLTLRTDANGNLGFCCMMLPFGKHFGNILQNVQCINADALVAVRASLLETSLPLAEECRQCMHLGTSWFFNT